MSTHTSSYGELLSPQEIYDRMNKGKKKSSSRRKPSLQIIKEEVNTSESKLELDEHIQQELQDDNFKQTPRKLIVILMMILLCIILILSLHHIYQQLSTLTLDKKNIHQLIQTTQYIFNVIRTILQAYKQPTMMISDNIQLIIQTVQHIFSLALMQQDKTTINNIVEDDTHDFALYPGAHIIHTLTSPSYITRTIFDAPVIYIFLKLGIFISQPETVLQPLSNLEKCWAMDGDHGQIAITLIKPIIITKVLIGHIDRHFSQDIRTAPYEMELLGRQVNGKDFTHLTSFLYNIYNSPIQTFIVPSDRQTLYSDVVLKVNSNWKHPNYTCLYRIGIHGH